MNARIGIEHRLFNLGLRRARERKGLTRKALAMAAGLHHGAVGEFENLKRWPSEETAIGLATILEESLDALFPESLAPIVRLLPARRVETEVEMPSLTSMAPLLLTDGGIERAEVADMTSVLRKAMVGLDERDRRVLALRFGLDGQREHTLDEIAEIEGVTRERIRQIQERGLRHLRHPARSKRLRGLVGHVEETPVRRWPKCKKCRAFYPPDGKCSCVDIGSYRRMRGWRVQASA